MTFRKLLGGVFAVLILGVHSNAFAQAEAGVPSLTIPPGARPNGMGEAYVAVADDATAGWWNAGGLAFTKNRNLAFMHSQLVPDLVSDVYYEYLGYSSPAGDVGVWSASLIYLTYGESIATDSQGGILRPFTSWEGALNASFAMQLGENMGAGITMKFIRVDYAPADVTQDNVEGAGTSFAVDLGGLYKFPNQRVNIGLSLTNMGPNIAFIDQEQSDPLPFTARVGAAYTPIADEISNLLLTLDVEQSLVWLIDSDIEQRRSEVWHVGAEYRYVNLLAGRVGYVYDQDGDFKDATYGLGFIYKDKLSLDYANVPQAQTLERVHRWSLYFTF
ncbi:MAG TPA: PorV/PorQ family protein [Candidatus Krumholzibacteria bacterium]|nr:PorV/PorQ family protein [Candidatus Krumholzibacteria bacterium]